MLPEFDLDEFTDDQKFYLGVSLALTVVSISLFILRKSIADMINFVVISSAVICYVLSVAVLIHAGITSEMIVSLYYKMGKTAFVYASNVIVPFANVTVVPVVRKFAEKYFLKQ